MLPKEVKEAKEAYYKAYDLIKDRIKENKKKYLGTKFEDCPPLIKEQGQFFVKNTQMVEVTKELTENYGKCERTWAYWVAWHRKVNEKNAIKTNAF